MKRLVIAIVAASTMMPAVVHSAEAKKSAPSYYSTLAYRASLFEGSVRRYISSTNRFDSPELKLFQTPGDIATNAVIMARIDAIISNKPPLQVLCRYSRNKEIYPLTCAAALEYYKDSFPNIVKKCRGEPMSPEENAAAAIETLLFHGGVRSAEDSKKAIGVELSRLVIPTLRRKGMAITVGKDGVSPVKVYADSISVALNAPQLDGINDILKDMNVPTVIDLRAKGVPTVQEARDMASRIMSGYEDAKSEVLGLLSIALGRDEYNAFIERYNGGSRW